MIGTHIVTARQNAYAEYLLNQVDDRMDTYRGTVMGRVVIMANEADALSEANIAKFDALFSGVHTQSDGSLIVDWPPKASFRTKNKK